MFNIKQINHATSNQRDRKIQEDLSAHLKRCNHFKEKRRGDFVRSNLRFPQRHRTKGTRIREQEVPQLAHPAVGHRKRRGLRHLSQP